MKYSDIVTLRESKAAYNIANEEANEWNTFIANEQFNTILERVIKSVFNNDADNHKSFWIEGTYGTGKSHAGAVIKHLLCDPVDIISDYVNDEYRDEKYAVLRSNIFNLRGQKQLFSVTLYGLSNIAHKEDLSWQLQRAISLALHKANINIAVKTDFENYIEHIEKEPKFWENLIEANSMLAANSPSREKLIVNLRNNSTDTLSLIITALRSGGFHIRINSANISQWIFEVQDKLSEQTDYSGLLIIWDEFTDVMNSPLGLSLLVDLQEITERTMNSVNNSYFLFISHPSALNSLKNEEREKTTGRYHYMKYNMEPVSAFKIMSRKFRVADGQEEPYEKLRASFFTKYSELLEKFSVTSTNPDETKEDICNLFPLHPATANLATYYAREAGSSSRSVFEFLGANPAIREFLNDNKQYAEENTITADFLWDYVLDVFISNPNRFGAIIERFNSYRTGVKHEGAAHFAVFKGILLLNALNNIANNEIVTPSEENIRNLYLGTSIESRVDEILNYFNEKSIIQRAPGGLFSIRFSALPQKEIEDIKLQLVNSQFKFTNQIVTFGDTAAKDIDIFLSGVLREHRYRVYSLSANEYTLLNQIENGYKDSKPYELFFALLFSRNTIEFQQHKEIAERAAKEERFQNVVFVVFDNVFSDHNYERFIEFQANAACAKSHGLADQYNAHIKDANEIIKEWMREVRRNNFTIYIQEQQDCNATLKLASHINLTVAPIIFSKGIEVLDNIRGTSKTYWKKQSVKATVDIILSFNTKSEIRNRCAGQAEHVNRLLQDSVDENLKFLPEVDKAHPLYLVCEFVNKKFKNTDKSTSFNLGDKLIELSQAPYGLYQSYAGMAMLAFAMRKYVKQIFDLNGKPRDTQHVVEDVVEVFKAWETGSSSNKLQFMFETKEARDVCDNLVELFQLRTLPEYADCSSLTDTRWAITHDYSKLKGFPLWSLKYSADSINEGIQQLIDNILKVCEEPTRNPRLLAETLDGIERFSFEMRNLLNDSNAFRNGFITFLKTIEFVNLQEDEADKAITDIKQYLQKEIGLWTPSEVEKALHVWRIQNRESLDDPKTDPNGGVDPGQGKSSQETYVSESKKTAVLQKVDKISDLGIAKRVLKEICEKGNEYVIDIINSHV